MMVKSTYNQKRYMAQVRRREEILDSARKEFAAKGYHQASMEDIVEGAGIAKGTFYLYFRSKQEIFGELLSEFMDALLKAFFIPGAGEVWTGVEVRERFELITSLALHALRDNEELTRLFVVGSGARDANVDERVRRFYAMLVEGAASNLRLWMDRGILRRCDPVVIAHCVVGMIERLIVQWQMGNLEGDFEHLVREVVRFELYGILKDPGEVLGDGQ